MKRAIVYITPELIMSWMITGVELGRDHIIQCVKGLPDDTKFITAFYDDIRRYYVLIVEHESFEDIKEGQLYPTICPTYAKHYPDSNGKFPPKIEAT